MNGGLESLNAIADPAERAQQALAVIESGRTLMEKAAEARARAALELYQQHGAAKAARLLGTSRVNLYRIMGQLPEVRQQRLSKTIEASSFALLAIATLASSTNGVPIGDE
jgi:hypothetical protein